MQRCLCFLLTPLLLILTASCGSGYNNPSTGNNGLFGNWNIVMYPNGSQNPSYVFALAISQEGTNNYQGSSIGYTGSVAAPNNMCINASALTATATVSGTNFTMTVEDTTTVTVITVQGSLSSQNSTLSGTYTNPASETCNASSGTMTMTPQ